MGLVFPRKYVASRWSFEIRTQLDELAAERIHAPPFSFSPPSLFPRRSTSFSLCRVHAAVRQPVPPLFVGLKRRAVQCTARVGPRVQKRGRHLILLTSPNALKRLADRGRCKDMVVGRNLGNILAEMNAVQCGATFRLVFLRTRWRLCPIPSPHLALAV